jgi:F-type H+-transporting ATPase subunit epsilon
MAATINLKLITPERIVFDKPVSMVVAKSIDGDLAILPGHEPLIAPLAIDVVRFVADGEEEHAAVMGGVLEVRENEVTVLSDVAELGEEIDHARATASKERLEAEKTTKTDKLDVYATEMAISRAITRLKAVELRNRKRRTL